MQLVLQGCKPLAQVDVAVAAELVVEKWLLHQTALMPVGQDMNAPKLISLLEGESVCRSQSSPVVVLPDSWSRDVQPS